MSRQVIHALSVTAASAAPDLELIKKNISSFETIKLDPPSKREKKKKEKEKIFFEYTTYLFMCIFDLLLQFFLFAAKSLGRYEESRKGSRQRLQMLIL